MATDPIELIVNGEHHLVSSRSDTPLLEVLRSELGLLGAKHACGTEQCGACKVLVDGQDHPSCCQPVGEVTGCSIQTVEGLAEDGRLDPLQEAFITETVTQCGYCVPGFLMAAKGLLHRNPSPTEGEIREAINRNLCRCGIHNRVVRAIQRVASGVEPEPIYRVVPPDDGLEPPPQEPGTSLPGSLAHHPDLDDWIRLRRDRGVDVYTGKVELGQGITTSLSQVVAEELDVDIARIRIHTADTATSLDEGSTAGSMSMEMSGGALRQAAAEFRYQLLAIAAEEFECRQEDLEVSNGMVQHPASGAGKDYWDLLPEGRLGMAATGVAVPKPPVAYSVVGQPVTRVDMESKVRGEPAFLQDMVLPDMLHARVVRGPVAQASLDRIDTAGLNLPDGVRLVRDGSFLAVMGEDEIEVLRIREQVAARCSWHTPDRLPDQQDLYQWMNAQASQDFLLRDGQPTSDPIPEPPKGDGVIHRTFHRPYQMHAAPGPSCAIAQLDEAGKLTVWSHGQGVFSLRAALAHVLDKPEEEIRVTHVPGPGCYGHNGADDVALDACLLALETPGRPVRVQWMREDEFVQEPLGTPMVVDIRATLNAEKRLDVWHQSSLGHTHSSRPRVTPPGETMLLAAWERAHPMGRPLPQPMMGRNVGLHRNAEPGYRIARPAIVKRFLAKSGLRTSSMRSLGALVNVWAIESMMDELAREAGVDPLEFRLQHLEDPRGRKVLEVLGEAMNWNASSREDAADGKGRGIGYGRYKGDKSLVAVGVDLAVDIASGAITLEEAHIVADTGQVINPDGLSAQLEGAFVQAASQALLEEVKFTRKGVASTDWDTYPILRTVQVPAIHTHLIRRDGFPVLGAGEAAIGPVPAAIGNALARARGKHPNSLPLQP
ncbi:MAG: molybdopterin-dependent oxidoreductase [Caldilineaceae bacterium SB0665_bin_21]|nr:molybdopterin-dependent oxidoreductase [Caldilineaceae bacterium SB0665_bin_21]